MAKNVAFFADGTWEDPTGKSNVWLLYQAAQTGGTQCSTYDTGLGTDCSLIARWFGGAFGAGLFQKIKDGYAAVARAYEPGDRVFLFGYSRGAYTARCLGGMIVACGLPTRNHADPKCVDLAFEAYRNTLLRPMLLGALDDDYAMDRATGIEMIGVWDTVGSLGIPALIGRIDPVQYGFLDTGLSPKVRMAAQALAIDERRMQFPPTLWSRTTVPGQTLEQVWFTGTHGDVGGGYGPQADGGSLEHITLRWMAGHAQARGLALKPELIPATDTAVDALADEHPTLTGLYRLTPHTRNIEANSAVASSVALRCAAPQERYTPANLHRSGGELAPGYAIIPV